MRTLPKHVPSTPLGDPQETPGEDQEAPSNTAGHTKAPQMIPKRLSGASQQPPWKDVSLMSVDSVDPTKVLQIAFKTGLAVTRKALKRRTGDPKRHSGDGESSQETTKLPLAPHKRHPRDPSTPQGPPSRASGNAWRAPRDPQERHWTPQSGPKSFPKGSLEAYRISSGKMYPSFQWNRWTLRKYNK